MKLEELSLNTKVEIDSKHQGFYGYKYKKTYQIENIKKTTNKTNKKTNKNEKPVSKFDNNFWELIQNYIQTDNTMEIEDINKENNKNKTNYNTNLHYNKNKMEINNYYDIMDKTDNILNDNSTKDIIINNIKPSIIKYFKYHHYSKENKQEDMDIEYKVYNSTNGKSNNIKLNCETFNKDKESKPISDTNNNTNEYEVNEINNLNNEFKRFQIDKTQDDMEIDNNQIYSKDENISNINIKNKASQHTNDKENDINMECIDNTSKSITFHNINKI